ncbi:MAG: BatA domain-containing protein [Planctomycetota bacterium]
MIVSAFAWSLSSAGMLGWAAAAAIPIVIHFWYRQRAKPERWAAMAFLAAALRTHARRLKLERWLLLAIRVAIPLVLALALADPLLPRSANLTTRKPVASTHLIVVLDGSYSMQLQTGSARPDGATLFDRAKEEALRRVNRLESDDGVTLILLADSPQMVSAEPLVDQAVVREELTELKPTASSSSLTPLWTDLSACIERIRRTHPRFVQHRVCIISDLTRKLWEEVRQEPLSSGLTALSKQAALEVIDVGQESSNAAVVQLTSRDPLLTIGREVILEAQIQDFGSKTIAQRSVEFWIDGRSLGRQPVEIPVDGRAAARISWQPDAVGDHVVSVTLDADHLPIDDERWLVLPVRQQASVLVVEGRSGEGQYLSLALNPEPSSDAAIRVETGSETTLTERSLASFSMIACVNLARFTREESELLRDYVRHGGMLLLFPGDLTQVDSYNAELTAEMRGGLLLSGTLGAPVFSSNLRFDARDYRDPLIAPFRGQERAGLLSTPIWTRLPIQLKADSAAQTALWFSDGAPAVVRQRLGKGETILFATAASPRSLNHSVSPPIPWTALPTWPSFLPMMQQTLRAALTLGYSQQNQLVGESWLIGVSQDDLIDELQVELPVDGGGADGRRIRVAPVDRATGRALMEDTATPGVYQAFGATKDKALAKLAVNVDTRESDLARIDRSSLPDCFVEPTVVDDTAAQSAEGSAPQRLFRECLWLLVGLLLSESTLAWWFGRARS